MARLLLRGSHHTEILANCAEISRADLRHDALARDVEATPRLGLRSMLLKLDPRERCAGALGHEPVMPLVSIRGFRHFSAWSLVELPSIPARSRQRKAGARPADRPARAHHRHPDTIWDISSSRCRSLPPSTEMRRPSLGRQPRSRPCSRTTRRTRSRQRRTRRCQCGRRVGGVRCGDGADPRGPRADPASPNRRRAPDDRPHATARG